MAIEIRKVLKNIKVSLI